MNVVQNLGYDTSYRTAFNAYSTMITSANRQNQETFVYSNVDIADSFNKDDVGRYSVFDIANWFLSKEEMTHKKVQKLCYYAQAWCYALRGYRLENTDYQAWVHGPVSPALWEKFKSFGYDPIRIVGKPRVTIAEEDVKLLEDVWDTYGENTGNALEALTHRELPWIEARRGYAPEEKCTVAISPRSMASYYKSIYIGD